MSKKSQSEGSHKGKGEKAPAARKRPASETEQLAQVESYSTNWSQERQAVVLQTAPVALRRAIIQRLAQEQGNQYVCQMIDTLQQPPPGQQTVMRAEVMAEATELATINADAIPLNLMSSADDNTAISVARLRADARLRILEREPPKAQVHVERGSQRGRTGWVPISSLTVEGWPTSQRATAGEDAYAVLQEELGRRQPRRNRILDMIGFRLTHDQQQRLLEADNPEFARLQALNQIRAQDMMRIMSLLGAPLPRKIEAYLNKRGRSVAALRLAFATANDGERLEVAENDALMGRLHRILRRTHPEIVFGPVIAGLYPADGSIETLRGTNPNLAQWLSAFVEEGQSITEAAQARARGLRNALVTMQADPAGAREGVMNAINAAPRGRALSDDEREALDDMEELAYQDGTYSSRDLGAMFLTRWARPFRGGATMSKTFLHRLWQTLATLPMDHALLNNILTFFAVNRSRGAEGSFSDFMKSSTFGQLLLNPPRPEIVHALDDQSGRRIEVAEPSVDLMRPGTQVTIEASDGTEVTARVQRVSVANRSLHLSRSVDVLAGAAIRPRVQRAEYRAGTAHRITTECDLYGSTLGGDPDTGNVLGRLSVGNLFSEEQASTVGSTNYLGGRIQAGPLADTNPDEVRWIDEANATPLAGGITMGQEQFAWTTRHEMGHSLDTQLNGFSRFSAPSAARWRKMPDAEAWLDELIAGSPVSVANSTASHRYNRLTSNFRAEALRYSRAVQANRENNGRSRLARRWLDSWGADGAAGGNADVVNTVTQFGGNNWYYETANRGLPAINGTIYAAHYGEWFTAADGARQDSLAVGVPPYAYTCPYEFFAEHYAAYTSPGVPPEQYAKAVPGWARNFFDRMVGEEGAGPRVGMHQEEME